MKHMQKQKEKGQSLLEFALILPVLLIILAGVLDLGRLYFAYVAVTDAAAEGATYAAMNPDETSEIIARAQAATSGLVEIESENVQIDCPVTAGFSVRTARDGWKLEKDARFRLWPAGSPLTAEGSLIYPVQRRWSSDKCQACSEPAFVGGEFTDPQARVYYHAGFDIGGPEGLVEVLAAAPEEDAA